MNFLDTLDSSDPKSWSGLSSPRSKKWSMQLRDSSQNSENSRNPSWVNNGRRGDHDREINRKRSDEKAALDKTISEIRWTMIKTKGKKTNPKWSRNHETILKTQREEARNKKHD